MPATMRWMGGLTAQAHDTYPDRPLRFVAPFPPEGSADNVERAIVPKATQTPTC